MTDGTCKHELFCVACGLCAGVCRCEPADLYAAEDLDEMSDGVDLLEPFTAANPKDCR